MDHPSDEILQRFATGTASREERRAVVAHLIQGCSQCARQLRALMRPQPVAGSAYDAVFERFNDELLEVLENTTIPQQAALRSRVPLMT
jgi:hypothetical protein